MGSDLEAQPTSRPKRPKHQRALETLTKCSQGDTTTEHSNRGERNYRATTAGRGEQGFGWERHLNAQTQPPPEGKPIKVSVWLWAEWLSRRGLAGERERRQSRAGVRTDAVISRRRNPFHALADVLKRRSYSWIQAVQARLPRLIATHHQPVHCLPPTPTRNRTKHHWRSQTERSNRRLLRKHTGICPQRNRTCTSARSPPPLGQSRDV